MGSNLQECPDCGRGVSAEAAACPGCGRPLARAEAKERTLRGWKVVEAASLVGVFVGAFLALSPVSWWSFAPAALGLAGFTVARVGAWWTRGG